MSDAPDTPERCSGGLCEAVEFIVIMLIACVAVWWIA